MNNPEYSNESMLESEEFVPEIATPQEVEIETLADLEVE